MPSSGPLRSSCVCCMGYSSGARSAGRRHREFRALVDAVRPALHDRFLLGIEAHAFFAVNIHVAEGAPAPAAETMPSHRHGDGHIDADHAGLHLTPEFAGGMA